MKAQGGTFNQEEVFVIVELETKVRLQLYLVNVELEHIHPHEDPVTGATFWTSPLPGKVFSVVWSAAAAASR